MPAAPPLLTPDKAFDSPVGSLVWRSERSWNPSSIIWLQRSVGWWNESRGRDGCSTPCTLRYQMIPKGSNFQDSCSTSPRQRVATGVSSLSGRSEKCWNPGSASPGSINLPEATLALRGRPVKADRVANTGRWSRSGRRLPIPRNLEDGSRDLAGGVRVVSTPPHTTPLTHGSAEHSPLTLMEPLWNHNGFLKA